MKKFFYTLLLFVFCLIVEVNAQTTALNPGLRLTINGKNIVTQGATFGKTMDLDVPLCADVVAVISKGGANPTTNSKAEGCDSILNAAALKDKIALVRRSATGAGTCDFLTKVSNAQKAGAIAVIIYDNVANVVPALMTGTNATITIPSCRISLEDGTPIVADLAAGKKVTACLVAPKAVINSHSGNTYLLTTPLIQADTVTSLVTVVNRHPTDTIKNIVMYSEITAPSGKVYLTKDDAEDIPPTAAGFINLLDIRKDYVPKEIGAYKVRIFGNLNSDTLTSQFFVTNYTFSADNGTLTGTGTARTPATFAAQFKKYSHLNFYLTGDKPAKATFATFGIQNAAQMKGRTFIVSVLKASEESIGKIASTVKDPLEIADGLLGDPTTYDILGTEKGLITVPLSDDTKKYIDLEPNGIYILAVEYDGSSFKDSIVPQYSLGRTLPIRWPGFSVSGTAVMSGDRYFGGGWSATEDPVGRLHLQGFTVGTEDNLSQLEASEFSVYPNPVRDIVNVKLDLKEQHQKIQLGITDLMGRLINVYSIDNQNSTIQINLNSFPSGTYFLTLQTNKGIATEKIIKE